MIGNIFNKFKKTLSSGFCFRGMTLMNRIRVSGWFGRMEMIRTCILTLKSSKYIRTFTLSFKEAYREFLATCD